MIMQTPGLHADFRVRLSQGNQLKFFIPEGVASARNINNGTLADYRLLVRNGGGTFRELDLIRCKAVKENSSLVIYIPKAIERKHGLMVKEELFIEIIGRVI